MNMKSKSQGLGEGPGIACESIESDDQSNERLSSEKNCIYARLKVKGIANDYMSVVKRNWLESTSFAKVDFFYKLVLMIAALRIIFYPF
ncbi:MAG: hypothetical protein ACRCVV_09275 [Shewanella sp.]